MHLRFATGNAGKVDDVRSILPGRFTVEQVDVDAVEPQDAALADIATTKVEQALGRVGGDTLLMADDSGLFVDALGGFPGILSSPFDEKVGKEKLLRLLDDDRSARFRAAIALHDPDTGDIHTFTGEVAGELVEPRGDEGFGYDPMFRPAGHDRTFAEDPAYKHEVSHRMQALDALRTYLDRRDS